MSADDSNDDGVQEDVRERLEETAEGLDARLVDLLSWILDTETRARIYVYLREHPHATSEEIADGTGLYPSTVREALAALHEEGKVTRGKRESGGAGNNPYEYDAMPPAELVGSIVEEVQEELNTVFNLDSLLGGETPNSSPVTINVSEDDTRQDDRDD
ncbi:winged helix-turn-helix transcriptional regulator [Natronomonas sp. EA1]|uniref:winged helix-turn-helix transcriptional regulator n=1 Tax=Natronomonas sp. EA1 TaxID=3421655 RepID=UPI003EBDE3B0